jgi:hypothetical protein
LLVPEREKEYVLVLGSMAAMLESFSKLLPGRFFLFLVAGEEQRGIVGKKSEEASHKIRPSVSMWKPETDQGKTVMCFLKKSPLVEGDFAQHCSEGAPCLQCTIIYIGFFHHMTISGV